MDDGPVQIQLEQTGGDQQGRYEIVNHMFTFWLDWKIKTPTANPRYDGFPGVLIE